MTDLPENEQQDSAIESTEKPQKVWKGGSRKGIPNKTTATAKENIVAVFTRLGGTAKMANWARKHQTEFYKLYARLIPVEVAGDPDAPLTIVFRDPTQRPEGYDRKPEP